MKAEMLLFQSSLALFKSHSLGAAFLKVLHSSLLCGTRNPGSLIQTCPAPRFVTLHFSKHISDVIINIQSII